MSLPSSTSVENSPARPRRSFGKQFLLWTRTLHIYVTLLGLILLIFFSFTGFILNNGGLYPDSGKLFNLSTPSSASDTTGKISPDLLAGNEHLFRVEQELRKKLAAKGELGATPDEDDTSLRYQFVSPGKKTDYEIAKDTGEVKIHQEHNILGTITDLHTGEHAGHGWGYFIDATSIILFFASISGLILWVALPKRRTVGIIALGLSIVFCAAGYFALVP